LIHIVGQETELIEALQVSRRFIDPGHDVEDFALRGTDIGCNIAVKGPGHYGIVSKVDPNYGDGSHHFPDWFEIAVDE
jgi:hypothetical protein